MTSTTNYWDKYDTPFEIHKNTVSFNNDIQKVMNDLLV